MRPDVWSRELEDDVAGVTNQESKDLGPGVPEALPRVVQRIAQAWPVERIDRLWLFPPLIRGRKESGLVAVSCRVEQMPDDAPDVPGDRRLLVTVSYAAERTGKGLDLDVQIEEEGEAPADRLPRVMAGVVVRSGIQLGDAAEVEIGGDADALAAWFDEVDEELLDPELPPRAVGADAGPEDAVPEDAVPEPDAPDATDADPPDDPPDDPGPDAELEPLEPWEVIP
jgi:hypothetical protein